MIETFASRAL